MAESIVQINEGTGKKLHTFNRTIGANSVEDEVIIEGEPYLAGYTVSDDTRSTATANSHLWQVMAGASLKVRVRRIEIFQSVMATAAVLIELRLYRLSTAGTGGGALTGVALDPGDAAAGFAGMSLPTVKGTETGLIGVVKPYMMQTIAASNQLTNPIYVFDFERFRSKPLIINAGTTNGIAIKNVTAVAGGSLGVLMYLDESNF